MDMIQIVGIAMIVTLLALLLKEQKPVFAVLLTTMAGMMIFLFLLDKLALVLRTLEDLARYSQIHEVFFKTLLKIIGTAYIAEFGAQIARDAGQESIAQKVELAGKVLIMVMALPIITAIIEAMLELLP